MKVLNSAAEAVAWLREKVVKGNLTASTKTLEKGDGFVAWPGAASDGRSYVMLALEKGAEVCLVEAEGVESFAFHDERIASLKGLKWQTAEIAAAFYDYPSHDLGLIAVTGTNGKTSVSNWFAQAIHNLPEHDQCGVIGTLGVGTPDDLQYTGLTTPDPVYLQRSLRRFVDQEIKLCAIEASSIGIAEKRLDATRIEVAILTNFTQDHLDYHGDMDAYWAEKEKLFHWPDLRAAVINVDDSKGHELVLKLKEVDIWTYSITGAARVQATDVHYGGDGLQCMVQEGEQSFLLDTELVGTYNLSNVLAVIAAMRAMGITLQAAVEACSDLKPVAGRMESITAENAPWVLVDYAHTPDALAQALKALRPLAEQRGGKLWCIFGCGGNRDASKRAIMGVVAQAGADQVVVTSDNPRDEEPLHIIDAIISQMHGLPHVEVDREKAIFECVANADMHDVILIAGKGHEDYQEVKGEKKPFDDRVHARHAQTLRGMNKS